MRVHYAIVFVSDMSRAVSFYRDALGLPLRFESPEWTEFETDGATLALHRTSESTGAPGESPRSQAGSCRPGLRVPNLDSFHLRMVEKKVPCLEPPKEVFGSRVAQYVDPDGLVISVAEDRARG